MVEADPYGANRAGPGRPGAGPPGVPGWSWMTPVDLMAGRVAGAGLLAWMGWIHLHLWNAGYKHLPTVGTLFLLNFIGGVVLAVAVLAVPYRLLGPAAAAGALMVVGTLGSLAISINIGLFGFTDSFEAPFVHLSIWVESLAIVVLISVALRATLATSRTWSVPARRQPNPKPQPDPAPAHRGAPEGRS